MQRFAEWKKATIRYWERRRIAYNIMLVVPALLGWGLSGAASAAVGDRDHLGVAGVVGLFVLYAIAANICYSFVYVLEFAFASDDSNRFWNISGRPTIFVLGVLLAIGLAFLGGRDVTVLQYTGAKFY